MLEKYLEQLVNELELEPVVLRGDIYTLLLGEDLKLELVSLSPGLMIYSPICICPENNREVLFMYLMKANFMGLSTGGSAIGLDKEEKYLTLSQVITYDINYRKFKELIEDFANYLDLWKEEIARIDKSEAIL